MALKDWIKSAADKVAEQRRRAAEAQAEAERQRTARNAELAENQRREDELKARIVARWPAHMFPWIPAEVTARFKALYPGEALDNFEEPLSRWETLLDAYPEPPLDDDERKQREDAFWNEYVGLSLVTSRDGSKRLQPKQTIMDRFWATEKWIFREYFAATGIYNSTYFGKNFIAAQTWKPVLVEDEFQRCIADPSNAISQNRPFIAPGPYDKAVKQVIQESLRSTNQKRLQEIEQYKSEAMIAAHREQWDNWFFFNIEQIYKDTYRAEPTASSPSADL